MIETIKIKQDNGKICTAGELWKQCFYKRVKKSKHYYKAFNAWGMDAQVFNIIVFTECNRVKIYDTESDIMYQVDVMTFKQNLIYKHFKPHRAQVFLKKKYFKQTINYTKTKKNELHQ